MVERDPKQAVLADLAASGTPFAADLSTVRFVKERRTPDRRLYWLAFEEFYAGGEIFAAGTEVAMVRLRFPNELILDDDAARGAALFLTDQRVEPPATVEICDRETTIASHEAF